MVITRWLFTMEEQKRYWNISSANGNFAMWYGVSFLCKFENKINVEYGGHIGFSRFYYSSEMALIGLQILNLRPEISWIRLFSSPLFITCQNFQFCKYVRLTVCLFVCVSVRIDVVYTIQVAPFDQSPSNFTQICTLVRGRHWIFFKVRGQITRSRGQKIGQILKSPYLS